MNHGSSVADNISSWFSGTSSLQHNYIFREEDFFFPAVLIFFICYFTDNNIVILLTMGPVIPL